MKKRIKSYDFGDGVLQDDNSLFPFLFFGFALAGLFDLFEIKPDQRGHLRRLPVGLFGILRPGERKMHNLSWLSCLFQKGERFQQDLPLSFFISNLTHRSSIGIFNGCCSGNPHSPVKLMGLRKDDSG